MFGNDKKGGQRPALNVDTLIGAQCTIEGEVRFTGGLHIEGTVKGSIAAEPGAEAVLMLSDKGRVEGEVRAPHVVINGQVRGDIVAAERVELAAQARVEGNIYYKVLEMTAGAQVCGHLVREDEPRKPPARTAELEVVADVVKEARRA